MRIATSKSGRLAMVTASGAFMMGFALLNGGAAHAIGCSGLASVTVDVVGRS